MILLILSVLISLLHPVYIYDPITSDAIGTRWTLSKDQNFVNGSWSVDNRKADYSNGTIKGLVTLSPNARHAISLSQQVSASKGTFVLQFENKIQASSFGCGGSYVKILNEEFNPLEFNDKTPYVIMFGPDKCDSSKNIIQFIYRTQNPLSKVWSEHALKTKIPALYDNITHLYTLIIKSDDTFEIKIDNKVKTSGSLHDDALFEPPFKPGKLIPDVNDRKPSDWVDAEQIPDANDTKPEDWDELAPPQIPDPNATKPEDWKEEESLEILDTNASKPADWNDEEDGPYQPGLISNPYCVEHGCGPWSPPLIKNPKYKGKWKPKMIPNPLYKGPWKAREVDNPYYFEPEKTLHQVGTIYGIGIEIVSPVEQWFSGIYVGEAAEEAADLAKEHWAPINAQETVAKEKGKKTEKASERKSLWEKLGKGKGWKENLIILAELAQNLFQDHPYLTISAVLVIIVVLSGLILSCWACCCRSSGEGSDSAEPVKAEGEEKKEAADAKDKKEDKDEEGEEEEEEEEEEGEDEEEGSKKKDAPASTITGTKDSSSGAVSSRVTKEKEKEKDDEEEKEEEEVLSKQTSKKGKKKTSHD